MLLVARRKVLGAQRTARAASSATSAHRQRQGAKDGLTVRLQNEASGQMGFSPDGRQSAFDNAYFIHVVDVEGNARPRQLPDQKAQNLSPDWSPDGQWLLFTSNRD